VPLELEAAELLGFTVTELLLEFVCVPLLAGLVTLLEESPISGSLPVLPPSHDARTNAAVASKAAIPSPSRFRSALRRANSSDLTSLGSLSSFYSPYQHPRI